MNVRVLKSRGKFLYTYLWGWDKVENIFWDYPTFKGEEKTPVSQFFIPNVNLYTTAAMRTLGFSSHTTGYWKHAMCYLMGQYTNPGVTFLANKFLHGKQKLEKEKNA